MAAADASCCCPTQQLRAELMQIPASPKLTFRIPFHHDCLATVAPGQCMKERLLRSGISFSLPPNNFLETRTGTKSSCGSGGCLQRDEVHHLVDSFLSELIVQNVRKASRGLAHKIKQVN
jgi:hypothetical protein